MKSALYCRRLLDTADAIVQKFLHEQHDEEAARAPVAMIADLKTLARNRDVHMLVAMISVLITSDTISSAEREQMLIKILQ